MLVVVAVESSTIASVGYDVMRMETVGVDPTGCLPWHLCRYTVRYAGDTDVPPPGVKKLFQDGDASKVRADQLARPW